MYSVQLLITQHILDSGRTALMWTCRPATRSSSSSGPNAPTPTPLATSTNTINAVTVTSAGSGSDHNRNECEKTSAGHGVRVCPSSSSGAGEPPVPVRDRLILRLTRVSVDSISGTDPVGIDISEDSDFNSTNCTDASVSSETETDSETEMDSAEDMEVDYTGELEATFEAMAMSTDDEIFQPPVGRDKQFGMLLNALGQPQGPTDAPFNIPCRFLLWGGPSSGKSHVVEEVLQASHIERSAQVSAFDLMEGVRVFLDEILRQLIGTEAELKKHCENGMQFLEALMDLNVPPEDRVVIVIHNAELLRTDHEDILYVLLSAQEETGMKICTILSSKAPPVGYFTTGYTKHIPSLHFPLYTRDELSQIIQKEFTELHAKKFFSEYLDAFINVQTKNCRDIRKLLRMFESSYHTFLQNPKVQTANSSREVWAITKTHIGTSFSSSHPSTSSSIAASESVVAKNLSLQAKYLLVAAYLASQNPVSSDKRFFVHSRVAGGSKKPNIITTGVKRESENGTAVVHSRLIAIVAALMKQTCRNWELTTGFLSIIPTLCNAGLIEAVGNPLDECKYRSCTEFDLIVKLGQDIGVDVTKCLYRML